MTFAIIGAVSTLVWMVVSELRIERLEKQYYELLQKESQTQTKEGKG